MESTEMIRDGAKFNETGVLLQYVGGLAERYVTPEGTTFIAPGAFKGCHIKELVIRGAWKIGQYACTDAHIEKITISRSVEKIGDHAFANIPELNEVSYEKNSQLKQVGPYCFQYDTSLKEHDIPSSVLVIDDYAFAQSGLESIKLPENLKILGEGAFMNCLYLKSIEIPDKIRDIKPKLCFGCTSLSSVKFPKKLTTIGKYAFYECKSLRGTIDHECKSLNLSDNDNLCLIESDSFAHCNSLKEVKLPQQLQEGFAYLQPYSFFDCPNLELMKLPKNGVMKAQKAISKCPLIIMEIYEAEICSEDLKGRNELMRDSPLFVRLASHLNALRKAVFPRKKSRKSSPITIPSPNYGLDEINTPTFAV